MEAILVRPEHCNTLSDVLARAFLNDPVCGYIFPDPEARTRKLRWIFLRWLRVLAARESAYTTPAMQGAALWLSPGKGASVGIREVLRAGFLPIPFVLNPAEQFRGLKIHLDAMARTHRLVDRPHWILDTLGVAPECHGQGLARIILQPILARADAESVPCFVITHKPANVAFYERMGFTLVNESPLWGVGIPVFSLRRAPNPGAPTQ